VLNLEEREQADLKFIPAGQKNQGLSAPELDVCLTFLVGTEGLFVGYTL